MTLQTGLYFGSILGAVAVTGLLARLAWKQRSVPGGRVYFWLALAMCLAALEETLSMVGPSEALALFWFKMRFLPFAVIPPLWFLFVLEYSGRRTWLSRRLLAGLFTIPLVTQFMVWTSGLHPLWVRHEVGFRPEGMLWLAVIAQRVPGIWYLFHVFSSMILMLAGSVLLLRAAWQLGRLHRMQAVFLAASALVPVFVTLVSTFNLLPEEAFNPTIPAFALGAALAAAAVFRFDFLKTPPAPRDALQKADAQEKRAQALFLLVFGLTVAGIAAAGYLSYQNFAEQSRTQVDAQLTAIASLKINGLEDWRAERLGDAKVLAQNAAFLDLAQHCMDNPADEEAQIQLKSWLDSIRNSYHYQRIFLLDTGGAARFSSPAEPVVLPGHLGTDMLAALDSGEVAFLDFHQHDDGNIYLALLVPLFINQDPAQPLGVLVMEIDPTLYLYPYLEQWPAPSETAETLLVHRDGEDALYLNPLRYQPEAALDLRFPLTDTDILAVKAVLGETGIVEGADYRGQAVIGYVGPVPGSPWFLVARMDQAEVYAPLRTRLWQTVVFFGALIAASGAGLSVIWRRQRMHYYRERYEAAEALRNSEARYRILAETSPEMIFVIDRQDKVQYVNNLASRQFGKTPEQVIGKVRTELFPPVIAENQALGLQQVLKSGEPFSSETQIVFPKGRLWLDTQLVPLLDEAGEVNAVMGVSRDITERKQAEESVRQQSEQLRLLYEASQQLNRTLDLDEINQTICDFMSTIAPNDGLVISNFDPETQLITCRAYWMENKWLDVSSFPPIPLEAEGKGTQSIVIRTGRAMLLNDFQAQVKTAQTSYVVDSEKNKVSKEIPPDEEITRSALIVPLKGGGRVTGVIQVLSYRLNAYTENQLKLLEALALHIASAEQNARLYAQVQAELNERKSAEEEIKKQLDELQRWHNATLGREGRILDLKREVNELLGKTSQPPRYPSAQDPKGLEDL